MATKIAPSLSPWAAVGLSTIMLLAIGFHLRRHESAVAPGILSYSQPLWCSGVFLTGSKEEGKHYRGFCPDHGLTGSYATEMDLSVAYVDMKEPNLGSR